ncbi:MAG: hypothetical protein QW597_05065 [Thermoplasmataceae archaeon]
MGDDSLNGYHGTIERINSINRYKGLLALQEEIWKMHDKYPFSVYANIKGRLAEKLRAFEDPNCIDLNLKIIFMNGSWRQVTEEDCVQAIDQGVKLTNFIFIKYPSAIDLEIPQGKLIGTKEYVESTSTDEKAKSSREFAIAVEVFKSRVEFMIHLIDRLEAMYSSVMPALVELIKQIGQSLRELYRRLTAINV